MSYPIDRKFFCDTVNFLDVDRKNSSTEKALDYEFVKGMEAKLQSNNPMDVRIARQGLALRRSSIRAQEALSSKLPKRSNGSLAQSIQSTSNTSLITLLEGTSPDSIFSPGKRALERRDTAATSPEPDDEIAELLDELRKRQPGPVSFSEDGDYVERLLAGVGQDVRCLPAPNKISSFVQGSFMPSRIPPPHQRQLNVLDSQLRRWGTSSWFYPKQLQGLEAKTYQEAPLAVQRRLIKEALEPDLILHFPNWQPFRMVGRGRYRVATELPDNKVTRNLLACMGGLADVVGGIGSGVPIEGHDGLDFHSLLCIKYAKEIDKKMRPPREEIVDGVLVVHGFPMDFKKRMETAEVFLAPLTYEVFDFLQPHGQISEHRLVHYHYWTGKDLAEENPDRYTLENTYQYPKPKHDWGNLPYHVKFTNPAEPSHIMRPARHSRLRDSELEALEARNEPPRPDEVTLRANALAAHAKAKAIANAKPRPTFIRRTSDKAKKVRGAPVLLGHKRVVSREKQAKDKEAEGKDHAVAQQGLLTKNGISQSSKARQASVSKFSPTSKEDPAAVHSSPDSILDYYLENHHSNPPDDEWTDVKNDQRASPALQSILVNQADNHHGSPKRSEKRSVCWAKNLPCPRSQSIDIPLSTSASTHKQRRAADSFDDDEHLASPSMALAIRDIEAKRQSGTLRFHSSHRGVSPVVEMAMVQLRDKELRMAASAQTGALADYETALNVLKEVVEENR